jgi:ABC-type dipeptide/oligopeptide/nickel transport system permease subunit
MMERSLELEHELPTKGLSQAPSNLWLDALRHLLEKRSAVVGLIMLGTLSIIAILAPVLATHDPIEILPDAKRNSPPCIHLLGCPEDQPEFYFGVDGNSRDFYSRVLYGARLSLQIGFVTVTLAIVTGTILGAVAGYGGGWSDNLIMRIMDVALAFPYLLLAIAIVAVLGPGLVNALLAVTIVSIPGYARIARASVLSVKGMDFVTADRALGVSHTRILFRRILPNAMTPLIVQGTLGIGTVIISAAALSFLGLGAQPPTPEWGIMLAEERNNIFNAPHLLFIPGIAITMTVLGFNLLGDGLRDALDPRLNR